MKGGARAVLMDIIVKQWSPIELYILAFLILSIVFVREYPKQVRRRADTLVGKTGLFLIAMFVSLNYSWLNGLLIGILTLLLLSMSPRSTEGFNNSATKVKVVSEKKLWWGEAILNENPTLYEEDDVVTSAIQDGATTKPSSGMNGPK
jgi:hypothetical protein